MLILNEGFNWNMWQVEQYFNTSNVDIKQIRKPFRYVVNFYFNTSNVDIKLTKIKKMEENKNEISIHLMLILNWCIC